MTKSANSINGVTGRQLLRIYGKNPLLSFIVCIIIVDLLNVMLECNNDDDEAHVITCTDVVRSVEKMKCRKACGPDGISTEAIKFGGHLLTVHLTLLFNLFLSHCYMPSDLLKTTVVPILKNKMGDISDVNNYRAIALPNSISKLLETIILNCFQSHDNSKDIYQFGFKKNHSTFLGCSTLKTIIDYYRNNGSYVFTSFLDLSKAFDSVNHVTLFKKLVDLKFPGNVVKLLIYWYAKQEINIRWKNIVTDSFKMRNGTRQGSALSPYLFCLYMRECKCSCSWFWTRMSYWKYAMQYITICR